MGDAHSYPNHKARRTYMKLLAIDGNSILNRAFYGIKALTNKNGEYTNEFMGL